MPTSARRRTIADKSCTCARSPRGIVRLYTHAAETLGRVRDGENIVVATGTASGKSLCYQVPLIETLARDPDARALLLFPTKALCQDQFKGFRAALAAAGLDSVMVGVFDGDTPSDLRRRVREEGRVESLVFLIGQNSPIDQYLMAHADYLFGRNPEQAVVDPDNPHIAVGHLKCAIHELPLADDGADEEGEWRDCPCEDGCPSCVGAAVPAFAMTDLDSAVRGRIPNKDAARFVMERILGQ